MPEQKSVLAKLSLIFSCASLLTPLFIGTIAGIVCGHLALREFERHPRLAGRRMAQWGLIIGYSSIVIIPLIIFGVLIFFGGICRGGYLNH